MSGEPTCSCARSRATACLSRATAAAAASRRDWLEATSASRRCSSPERSCSSRRSDCTKDSSSRRRTCTTRPCGQVGNSMISQQLLQVAQTRHLQVCSCSACPHAWQLSSIQATYTNLLAGNTLAPHMCWFVYHAPVALPASSLPPGQRAPCLQGQHCQLQVLHPSQRAEPAHKYKTRRVRHCKLTVEVVLPCLCIMPQKGAGPVA
jgi:hypothetical protein